MLAGEISKNDNLQEAFLNYNEIMRPFVKEGQGIPRAVVRFLWPHTRLGLFILRTFMRVAGSKIFRKIFSKSYVRNSDEIILPDYKMNLS